LIACKSTLFCSLEENICGFVEVDFIETLSNF